MQWALSIRLQWVVETVAQPGFVTSDRTVRNIQQQGVLHAPILFLVTEHTQDTVNGTAERQYLGIFLTEHLRTSMLCFSRGKRKDSRILTSMCVDIGGTTDIEQDAKESAVASGNPVSTVPGTKLFDEHSCSGT